MTQDTEFGLDDVNVIEGNDPTDGPGYFKSIQRAINAGLWSLQGSYGRSMMHAIEQGRCMLGPRAAADAYGHRIPGRDQVKIGTKGSRQYVVDHFGEDWAAEMEGVAR